MLYAVELQLTTPMLGDRYPDHTGIRRFERAKDNHIQIRKELWEGLLHQAQRDMGTGYHLPAVNFPPSISAPQIQAYKRRYNRTKIDRFEAIQKGAKIRFTLLVRSEPGKPCPGQEGLMKLLSHIGEWIGISPWGRQFDYGRFKVVHVTPKKQQESPIQFESPECFSSSARTGT